MDTALIADAPLSPTTQAVRGAWVTSIFGRVNITQGRFSSRSLLLSIVLVVLVILLRSAKLIDISPSSFGIDPLITFWSARSARRAERDCCCTRHAVHATAPYLARSVWPLFRHAMLSIPLYVCVTQRWLKSWQTFLPTISVCRLVSMPCTSMNHAAMNCSHASNRLCH